MRPYTIRVHYLGKSSGCIGRGNDFRLMNEQITKYAGCMQCTPTPFGYIGWQIIWVHHSGALFVRNIFWHIISKLFVQIEFYSSNEKNGKITGCIAMYPTSFFILYVLI
jgi:hypothetical protein